MKAHALGEPLLPIMNPAAGSVLLVRAAYPPRIPFAGEEILGRVARR